VRRYLLGTHLLLTALGFVWFAGNLDGPRGPPLLGWLPVSPSLALAAVGVWWVSTADGLPPAARRFWRQLSAATAMCAVGTFLHALDALADPRLAGEPEHIPGPALLLYLGTILTCLWALLRIPVGRRPRGEWVRLGLDATVVMLGAGLFIWYFAFSPLLENPGTADFIWVSLLAGVLSLVAVSAITKVVLTGAGSVDIGALRLLALGLMVGGLSSTLAPLVTSRPQLSTTQISVPLITLLLSCAGQRQLRSLEGKARSGRRWRRDTRPYSLLPYAAVIATDALLLVVARTYEDPKGLVVIVTAVTLTGLVGIRQLTAFADNARLLLRLRQHEQRFRSLVQNASDLITILDVNGSITYVSPAVERVLGMTTDALKAAEPELVHPDDLPLFAARIAELFTMPGHSTNYQVRLRHADSSWRWLDVTSTNLLEDPSVRGMVNNCRDITEQKELQERLRHQASHDDLTKLANRTLFAERVEGALAVGGDDAVVTVLLVDLDDFKTVNDSLGHAVGDALLVAISGRLNQCIRSEDTVARLGGDEFAVLLRERRLDRGIEVAERILASLARPALAHGHTLLVQASIGIVQGGPGDDAGALLRDADIAMYAAKEHSKGGYACYTPGMEASILQHAELGVQLRQALAQDQLHLVYQPIVSLPDGGIAGVEALARWDQPTRGPVPPLEFIPVAERTGLIVPLGRWVLQEACRQAAAWRRAHGDAAPAIVSVNVAARQLQEPGFVNDVVDALRQAGLEPHHLVIEATESAVLKGGQVLEALRGLHALGVRLALDDFGTGQSSLGLLQTCPVSILKLDKSFVDAIADAEPQAAVATAVILTAQALGLDTIAEGIETAEQAGRLWELGYRLGQGYHFARPLAAEEVALLLAGVRTGPPGPR
jgi:diguanylate cyclase (GGDEF)-like protein/PAS domain S-box-containing protein